MWTITFYVGIAPREAKATITPSRRTLRDRLRDHLAGNAEARLSPTYTRLFACASAGNTLQLSGAITVSPSRTQAKSCSDRWLATHAHVAFTAFDRPWEVEARLLKMISLPLNISGNAAHSCAADLSRLRAISRREAAVLPVVADSGDPPSEVHICLPLPHVPGIGCRRAFPRMAHYRFCEIDPSDHIAAGYSVEYRSDAARDAAACKVSTEQKKPRLVWTRSRTGWVIT